MSINDKNTQGNAQQDRGDVRQQMGGGQQQQSQNTSNNNAPTQRGFSFNNLNGLNQRGAVMGRSPASEVLTKLSKALTTAIEGADPTYDLRIIPIDKDNARSLSLSVIVVAMQDKQAPDLGVALHTLVLEGSIDAIANVFENINGTNVEVIRTAADAYDNETKKVVVEFARRQFGNVPMLDADSCVVPRGFNVQDPQAVHVLAANAAIATQSRLNQAHPEFRDINLHNAQGDATLQTRVSFMQGAQAEVQDVVGQVQRADVVIDFSAVANQQQGNQGVQRATSLARISGYMDLVWAPEANQQQANPWMQMQQNTFQRYAARFVMTGLESTDLLTLPAQLLALISANSLREHNTFFKAWAPNKDEAGLDLNDFGAVGIEANFENNPSGVGERVNTKTDTFNMGTLGKLVSATVKQGLIISLDVPECGPSTWYNGVFSACAEGSKKAYDAIYNAAVVLTNGNFTKYFPQGAAILGDEFNRIHLGHFSDKNGVHDLRRIDYLAALNVAGERDPAVVRDLSDTYLRVEYPLAQRLAARKKIFTALFGDSVTVTGFARRVTFTSQFIDALSRAAKEAGLSIRNVTQTGEMTGFERSVAQGLDATLMQVGTTGMFSYGGYGAQQVGNGMTRGFNRWNQ